MPNTLAFALVYPEPTVSTVILSITPVEFTVALAKAPVPSPSMKILVLGEKRVVLAARLLVTAALLILTLFALINAIQSRNINESYN